MGEVIATSTISLVMKECDIVVRLDSLFVVLDPSNI